MECPNCGKKLHEGKLSYFCFSQKCDFAHFNKPDKTEKMKYNIGRIVFYIWGERIYPYYIYKIGCDASGTMCYVNDEGNFLFDKDVFPDIASARQSIIDELDKSIKEHTMIKYNYLKNHVLTK